jgi:hypothetical protein
MKDKYVRFIDAFEHCQIQKFNGTSGIVTIEPDNVGVYNCENDMYEFKETEGLMLHEKGERGCTITYGKYEKELIKPAIFSGLINPLKDKKVKFFDSICDMFSDEDDKRLWEDFEIRLFTAKSQIDVSMAKLYFNAGQIDRLEIKQSLMRLKSI